jgi:uncharacterized protein YdaU (DUF1376 family)
VQPFWELLPGVSALFNEHFCMNYYPFNIGDYRRQTTHLSLLEHGIYRSLLDTYYLNEAPLCSDDAKLMRTHCIRTDEEVAAFENVLADFFTKTENGYFHGACEKVIDKYKEKSQKASNSAKARWSKEANAMRTHSEGNANQEPRTNNHKPVKEKKGTKRFVPPSVQDVRDYCKARNNKVDPERFIDHYTSNGWKVGKNSMKDWKASVRTWEKRDNEESSGVRSHKPNAAERYHDALKEIAAESCGDGFLEDAIEVRPQMAVLLPNTGDD